MTPVLLLLALSQPAAATPPPLQIGFAKRVITPAIGAKSVYMAGFDNDRKATGVHDDLWARAVALSDGRLSIAIVSVDLIGFFHADVLKARELLKRRVPGAVLVVASTHDHEGPDTMGLWGSGRFSSGVDPQYLRARMEERLGGTCVFLVGSIGGLMTPLGVELRAPDGTPIPKDSFALAQTVGERAADAALAALATGKPSASQALEHRSATVFVPLENRLFRLAILLGVLDRELFSSGRPATSLFGDDMQTEVGYLRIGDGEVNSVGPSAAARLAEAFALLLGR